MNELGHAKQWKFVNKLVTLWGIFFSNLKAWSCVLLN
jgi:hypothetical protein